MNVSVAEVTPRGSGAVSVLRVRGPDAASAVRDLCGGVDPARGSPRRVRLIIGGEDLDEALACALPSGEFELHVHGSPSLVRRLTGFLGSEPARRPDARPDARPGAQSIEERAAEGLALALCEGAARTLLDQAEGALTRELRSLALEPQERRDRAIDALLSRWNVARRALEPAEVVIAGSVNAGKSTLFNALLGERRAIVGPEPGTTRDRLRARALLGEWPVWISDTAGGRDPSSKGSASPVEQQGQERARRAWASADLVLWLEPLAPGRPPAERPPRESGERAVLVHTFADRVEQPSRTRGALSALRDPAGARKRVSEIFRSAFSLPADPWIPGAAVPLTSDQARAIAILRGRDGIQFERALEALLAHGGGPSAPASVAPETRIP